MSIAYNPNQKMQRNLGGASPNNGNTVQWGGAAPQQSQLSNKPAAIPGRSFAAGSNVGDGMFAPGVTYDMLGTGQWGTGESFQGAARQAALSNIRDARSTANPEDYAAMDEMRNYYRTALADLPGNTEAGISSFDTQSQFGLKNLLSQQKNAAAGRGTMGSRQYAGAQGDLMSRANQDYMRGLIEARMNAIDQANKLNAGLGMVRTGDLAEREYQLKQGGMLSDAITKQQMLDLQRQGSLGELNFKKDQEDKGMVGNLIGAYMSMLGYGAASGALSKSA